ncbi:MAG: YggS family pyridoxal phosphate-dependent enzyme [Actinobacteria bacterium]|nr:YggS family pyridoxal phosphate-dependent enzyme [Actinomycetota bacterium]
MPPAALADRSLDRLSEALTEVRSDVAAAARTSGRMPEAVEIVVAGKYIPAHAAPTLVAAGVGVVGESRIQDLLAKRAVVGDALTFDFIGHLQRRKVRDVLREVRLVHAVDSDALVHEIARRQEGRVRVLVEVNVANEPNKYGISPAALPAFVARASRHPDLVIGGLMCMPPPTLDPASSRPHFSALRELSTSLVADWTGRHDFRDLSMGTSQDYVAAVEEGATMVRLGRGLLERAKAG